MKLSILITKTQRDNKYCELLLSSIKKTIALNTEEYEIITHDNDHVKLQGSLAHATGLTDGYKKTKGEIVLILDPDTYFFDKDWGAELLSHFEDQDVVFCAGIRCDSPIYQMSFYRSHFLAIRSSFYRNLIINEKGFFPELVNGKMINDMAHKITKYCIDSGKKYIHYKNSLNDDLPMFYKASGETVYNKHGKAFFHHMGRGSTKPERLLDWLEFWKNQ
jgi:hypothetical protein